MLKHLIIKSLHKVLGFENYLFTFSIFKINTLGLDNRKKEFVYFSKLFKDDSNVIVIGANTGITTIPFTKKITKGKIFAFEPVAENYSTLLRVIKYFKKKNIQAFSMALGEVTGEIRMLMPIINSTKSHGMCYVKDESIEGFKDGIEYNVRMEKLDNMPFIRDIKIDGIKIVAENYESFILEGARETILKNRPLIYCELWFNENRKKTLDKILSWDYQIKVLHDEKLIRYDDEIHHTKNLFFVPKEI